MDGLNLFVLIGLAIRLISFCVMLFYILPKQFAEVLRPRDWLTSLRWQIFLLFSFSVIAATPALTYQFLRAFGHPSPVLYNLAVVFGNLSTLGTTILLVMIYNYKNKE